MKQVTKFVVGSTFGIYPPRGGGQLRIFHLYRQLARVHPVDIVALVDGSEPASRRTLAPGLTEIRVPKSSAHFAAEAEIHRRTGLWVTDVAFIELHRLTPSFADAVAAAMTPGCVLVASHPYTYPAMREVAGDAEWWYDAHNVEADLKSKMLPAGPDGKRLLAQTRAVERECCLRAGLILTCSANDGERLRALYGVPAARMGLVANGVDVSSIRFTAPSERRALRERLRMAQPLALFVGSGHQPNLLAAREVIALARHFPEVRFAIVGSVGLLLADVERTPNVELFGAVSDELKQALLSVASVALNPMLHGSGTNMKMLDYLAAGLPVITTEVGARGLDLDLEADVRLAEPFAFAEALTAALREPDDAADERARSARRRIEERFDWEVVCRPLVAAVAREGEPAAQVAGGRSAINA